MQAQNPHGCCIFIGGDEGDRTPDLLNAIGPHRSRHYQNVTFFRFFTCFLEKVKNKCYDFEHRNYSENSDYQHRR